MKVVITHERLKRFDGEEYDLLGVEPFSEWEGVLGEDEPDEAVEDSGIDGVMNALVECSEATLDAWRAIARAWDAMQMELLDICRSRWAEKIKEQEGSVSK